MDYLLRSSLNYKIINYLKKLDKKTFIENVYLIKKAKYIIVFIYNTYKS